MYDIILITKSTLIEAPLPYSSLPQPELVQKSDKKCKESNEKTRGCHTLFVKVSRLALSGSARASNLLYRPDMA